MRAIRVLKVPKRMCANYLQYNVTKIISDHDHFFLLFLDDAGKL